jgi:hypothetical protein
LVRTAIGLTPYTYITWDIISDSIYEARVFKDNKQIGSLFGGVVSGKVLSFDDSSSRPWACKILGDYRGISLRFESDGSGEYYIIVSNGFSAVQSGKVYVRSD